MVSHEPTVSLTAKARCTSCPMCCLLPKGPNRLRLSATDLYLGVTAVVPASIKKGGTIAVAARTLFDIVKNLPDGERSAGSSATVMRSS